MIALFRDGGPVMYPLLMCSIISLAVIIERTIFWIQTRLRLKHGPIDPILRQCAAGNWEEAARMGAEADNYASRVLGSGIRHRRDALSKAMESAAADEINQMRRYMGVLDTMITVSPLLGILGTVTGIIVSFEMLGAGGIEDPKTVTAGIAQALITTAAGLTIAISALFPCTYFNTRIEKAIGIIEKYGTCLEILHLQSKGLEKEKHHES